MLREVRHHRIQFDKVLAHSVHILTRVDWWYRLGLALVLSVFIYVSWRTAANSPEGLLFDYTMRLLTTSIFLLLAFHAFQVIVLWSELRELLRQVARLSLVKALDRMPSRVARWFFELPTSGDDRLEMVARQADALAKLCTDEVKAELQTAYPGAVQDHTWANLKAALGDVWKSHEKFMTSVRSELLPLLILSWKGQPVTVVFADTAPAGAAQAGKGQPSSKLDEWFQNSEDLVALQLMRWLGPSLNQIWTIIGFLVIASISLTFAVTSYPFPMQGTLFSGLQILAVLIAIVTLLILVGTNRDEIISRVTNKTPNKLSFDGALTSGLFAYILPLLGLVAALSLDTSDLIHTLIDPITRGLS
jgi:hypothetical protein